LEQQLVFKETCERYLLGELSEAEREQLEESYFADDALFDRFLAVKDELLDAYARGELAEEKRTRFAQHFLATASRRQQLDETQEFIRAVTAVSTKTNEANAPLAVTTHKSSWWKSLADFFKLRPFALSTTLAAALLLIVFSGVLVSIQFYTFSQKAVGQLENDKPHFSTVRPPKHIAYIRLLPVASRDINEANTLHLSSDTRAVRVILSFKNDDYRNYNAKLTTVAGASVWQQKTLKADTGGANKSVTLQFASALLRQQDYIVTLSRQTAAGQTETIGEYYFHVERSSSQNKQTQTPQP